MLTFLAASTSSLALCSAAFLTAKSRRIGPSSHTYTHNMRWHQSRCKKTCSGIGLLAVCYLPNTLISWFSIAFMQPTCICLKGPALHKWLGTC